MERNEIVRVLRELVAESLALKPERVRPESRLVTDLGADSLDFVDLLFGIEQRFGVRIAEGDFAFVARLDLSSPAIMRDGRLTPETVKRIREWLPALGTVGDPAAVTPAQVFSMITIETLALLVEKRLAAGGSLA
ncbi:MAG: hypothetical protein HYY17_00465 [Planctomycetes bacterium]|nr:hypothetical protein [Planctomycetota bacterium]